METLQWNKFGPDLIISLVEGQKLISPLEPSHDYLDIVEIRKTYIHFIFIYGCPFNFTIDNK